MQEHSLLGSDGSARGKFAGRSQTLNQALIILAIVGSGLLSGIYFIFSYCVMDSLNDVGSDERSMLAGSAPPHRAGPGSRGAPVQ